MTPIFQRCSALVSCEKKTAVLEDRSIITATGAPTSFDLLGDREYPLGGAQLGKAYAHGCDLKPSGKGLTAYSSLQAALTEANLQATTPP